MTDTPEPSSGGQSPSKDESARPPILSQEKVPPIPVVPGGNGGVLTKYQESRENTKRQMAGIARDITEVQSELQRVETRLEGADLVGPDREKLRRVRNSLRDRLEGLEESQAAGQRRLDHLDLLLRSDAAENAIATRRGSQGAAELVAIEIRNLIGQVAELWGRFQVLREEDRVQADVVRSISPGRLNEVTTFSWTTGVDQTFAGAIETVITQCHRVNKELLLREKIRGVR